MCKLFCELLGLRCRFLRLFFCRSYFSYWRVCLLNHWSFSSSYKLSWRTSSPCRVCIHPYVCSHCRFFSLNPSRPSFIEYAEIIIDILLLIAWHISRVTIQQSIILITISAASPATILFISTDN